MGDTDRFLTLLEDMLPPGQDILLWFLHPQTGATESHFIRTAAEGVALAEAHTDWHAHYGVGTRPHQSTPRPSWRGTEQDVVGLFEVQLDIDIASPIAHKVSNLPPDIPSAMKILEAFPTPPTLIIFTGYGLHAIWLFKEIELLESTADRIAAKDAVARVQNWARKAASAHGWALDHTHDLSRSLRLPGTKNHKSSPPVDCVILSDDGPRYGGLSDFLDEYPPVDTQFTLSDEQKKALKALTKEVIFSDRFVSPQKFQVMLDTNRSFRSTWEKERRGMTDYSQSGFDMAIACICLKTERWSMQEIASLLMQYRAKYGKPTREAYLHFTLQHAHLFVTGVRKKKSERAVDFDAAEQTHAHEQAEAASQREEANKEQDAESTGPLLLEAAVLLHFPEGAALSAVYVTHDLPRTYTLLVNTQEGQSGRIVIDAAIALNMTKLYEAVWKVTGKVITTLKKDMLAPWGALWNRLCDMAVLEPEDDISLTEVVRSVLRVMARDGHEVTADTDPTMVPQFIRNSETFTQDGVLSFSIQELVKCGTREIPRSAYTPRNYTDVLKTIGAKQNILNLSGTPRVFRRRWSISREDIGLP